MLAHSTYPIKCLLELSSKACSIIQFEFQLIYTEIPRKKLSILEIVFVITLLRAYIEYNTSTIASYVHTDA